MLRQTLIAAFSLLSAGAASAQSAPNAWSTTALNFRDAPNNYANVVAYVPHCAAITTYEWQDGWFRATWDTQAGWVWGAYLAASNAHCQTSHQPPAYVPPVAAYQPPAYQPPVYQPPVAAYQPPAYQPPAYQPPAYVPPASAYQPAPRRTY